MGTGVRRVPLSIRLPIEKTLRKTYTANRGNLKQINNLGYGWVYIHTCHYQWWPHIHTNSSISWFIHLLQVSYVSCVCFYLRFLAYEGFSDWPVATEQKDAKGWGVITARRAESCKPLRLVAKYGVAQRGDILVYQRVAVLKVSFAFCGFSGLRICTSISIHQFMRKPCRILLINSSPSLSSFVVAPPNSPKPRSSVKIPCFMELYLVYILIFIIYCIYSVLFTLLGLKAKSIRKHRVGCVISLGFAFIKPLI